MLLTTTIKWIAFYSSAYIYHCWILHIQFIIYTSNFLLLSLLKNSFGYWILSREKWTLETEVMKSVMF